MLSKIRHYADIKTLKSIYHAIFESHLSYVSFLGQKRLHILHKKKSFRLFRNRDAHRGPFFKKLKFSEKVALLHLKKLYIH